MNYFVSFNCFILKLSEKTVFFSLKTLWQWRRLPKIYECDYIGICWKKQRYNLFQIYQCFICSLYRGLSLSQTRENFGLEGAWEIVCVIYDFIGEMIFWWNHYRYGCLKSVRVSKIIISQIYIRNKNKDFGKRVPFK